MVMEGTDHLPSYAEAKMMKLLTLHTYGYFRTSLQDCPFSSFSFSSSSVFCSNPQNGVEIVIS